jgi:hypothetical protein
VRWRGHRDTSPTACPSARSPSECTDASFTTAVLKLLSLSFIMTKDAAMRVTETMMSARRRNIKELSIVCGQEGKGGKQRAQRNAGQSMPS